MSTTTLNDDNQPFELPAGLKQRCVRTYGWDPLFAEAALEGYRQFIKLQLQQEDWHATILSPPATIDRVWQQHILNVGQYVKACNDYAGHLIDHDPDGGLDVAARAERIKSTKLCLKTLFGRKVDEEIWSFGEEGHTKNPSSGDDNNQRKRRRVAVDNDATEGPFPTPGPIRSSVPSPSPSRPRQPIDDMELRIRDKEGDVTLFNINRRATLQNVFDTYARRTGLSASDLTFVLNGNEIDGNRQSAMMLQLKSNDQIDVFVRSQGGIKEQWKALMSQAITVRIRDSNGVINVFKMKRGTKLHKAFQLYAQRLGGPLTFFLFYLRGKRIRPTETPHMLGIEDEDHIDVLRCHGM